MTRLASGHPPIEVELGSDGRLVAFRWNGRREPVEVCLRWRIEQGWWDRLVRRDYYKLAGEHWLVLVYQDLTDGSWHLERLYD